MASNTLMMRLGPDVWGSHPALVEIFLFKISVQSVPALIVHFSQVRNAAIVQLRARDRYPSNHTIKSYQVQIAFMAES